MKEKEFHEISKRAFASYFDFLVFAKNNQHTRMAILPKNVGNLDLMKFAESYGLNAVPKLRNFKTKQAVKKIDSESESDEELLTTKKEGNLITLPEVQETLEPSENLKEQVEKSSVKVNTLDVEQEKIKLKTADKTDKLTFKQRQKAKKKAAKLKRKLEAEKEEPAFLDSDIDETEADETSDPKPSSNLEDLEKLAMGLLD